jgi:hypothetical protein
VPTVSTSSGSNARSWEISATEERGPFTPPLSLSLSLTPSLTPSLGSFLFWGEHQLSLV